MRPLRLELEAFGPYAGLQVIDFRELGARSFFLIHGPTGAGKTSILDAVSYALYGEPSGADRPIKHLRSDHASVDQLTRVTFEFSAGPEIYVVRRSPEQTRPKKRGEGVTTERYTASLHRLTPDSAGAAELLASQPSRVTEKIEELLGFQCEQFRQVIMLPQGKFQSFLTGDSRRRQEILDVLFRTSFFRRVEENLKEAARSLREQAGQWSQRRALIFEQAEVSSGEDLEQLFERERSLRAELAAEVQKRRAEQKKAADALEAARQVEQKLSEQQTARAAHQRLVDQQEATELKEARHRRGLAAAGLDDSVRTLRQRQAEAQLADKRSLAAQEAMRQAQTRDGKAVERLECQRQKENERQTAHSEVDRLEQMGEKATSLALAVEEQTRARQACKEAAKAAEDARQSYTELERQVEQGQAALVEAQRADDRREALKMQVQEVSRARTSHKALVHVQHQIAQHRAERATLSDRLERDAGEHASRRQELVSLETTWRAGQAAALAAQLCEGDPCPVCGSTDHPRPARPTVEIPAEADLRRRRQDVDQLSEELQQTRSRIALLDGETSGLEKEEHNLRQALGDYAQQAPRQIQEQLTLAQNRWQQAEEKARQVDALTRDQKRLAESLAGAEESLRRREEEHKIASLALAQQEAVVKTRGEGIPAELRRAATLTRAQEQARRTLSELLETLSAAQQEADLARADLSRQQALLQETVQRKGEAEAAAGAAEQDLLIRLDGAGFSDLEDLQGARLSSLPLALLEQEILEHRAACSAAADRLRRAEEAAIGLSSPDLPALEEAAQQGQQALEEVLRLEEGAAQRASRAEEWIRSLAEIEARADALDQQYMITGRLAEVASGKNPAGLTFQRYVLAARLEQVLCAATERLRRMSRGRFLLQRTQQRTNLRSLGGLDMEVYDALTGTNRPVNTLSGGEIFLASLSLALGLADVVQADSGGIRMDTIFVDEGFGSLDSETLDRALDTLVTLQEGGRLVGIISHVEELKERIGNRLEVTPVRRGSAARFVLE